MTDPHSGLLRNFARAPRHFGALEVARSTSRPWASATFTGVQHRFTVPFTGPERFAQAEGFAAWLASYEFVIPGHLVADVATELTHGAGGDAVELAVEVLTIETC